MLYKTKQQFKKGAADEKRRVTSKTAAICWKNKMREDVTTGHDAQDMV